jgi:hypothetical protein
LVEEKSVMEQGERGFYVGQNVGMYIVGMHIHIVPNRGASPTVLLRESYRDGRTVKKRTLANLSSLPPAQVETIRAALRGEVLRPVHQSCEIIQSRAHGHLAAVAQTMRRLGMALVVAATPYRERDLVLAMVGPCQVNCVTDFVIMRLAPDLPTITRTDSRLASIPESGPSISWQSVACRGTGLSESIHRWETRPGF